MYDAQIARVAALYRSGTSTDSRPTPTRASVTLDVHRARAWQAELARSVAEQERRQHRAAR
jgi:hypothetical protein